LASIAFILSTSLEGPPAHRDADTFGHPDSGGDHCDLARIDVRSGGRNPQAGRAAIKRAQDGPGGIRAPFPARSAVAGAA